MAKTPETSADDNLWTLAMVEASTLLGARDGRLRSAKSSAPNSDASPGRRGRNGDMTAGAADRQRRRVLLIGLDAGDAELIEQWCAEGALPNIAANAWAGHLGVAWQLLPTCSMSPRGRRFSPARHQTPTGSITPMSRSRATRARSGPAPRRAQFRSCGNCSASGAAAQ